DPVRFIVFIRRTQRFSNHIFKLLSIFEVPGHVGQRLAAIPGLGNTAREFEGSGRFRPCQLRNQLSLINTLWIFRGAHTSPTKVWTDANRSGSKSGTVASTLDR